MFIVLNERAQLQQNTILNQKIALLNSSIYRKFIDKNIIFFDDTNYFCHVISSHCIGCFTAKSFNKLLHISIQSLLFPTELQIVAMTLMYIFELIDKSL